MENNEAAFEEPLTDLRRQIQELESFPETAGRKRQIERLKSRLKKQTEEVFRHLTPWQTVLVARHFDRPHTLDYVDLLMEDWVELHGDRAYADDPAMVCGLARFRGRRVAVVGHQKGRGTTMRIRRNFGQPRPEGYRKALRVMKLAERFGLPVLSFIDTPGAYPGLGAEQRGQAEAIAKNLLEMAALEIPIVVVVTGEGGSGGALAIGVGNRVFMLRYSIYSVISPEGCAAILWKDQDKKIDAASAMRITAPDLLELGIVDGVIPEPPGGAHTDPVAMARRIGGLLEKTLDELSRMSAAELVADRYSRFRRIGAFSDGKRSVGARL